MSEPQQPPRDASRGTEHMLKTVLSEIGMTAATVLADENITDWAEGGRLGDALLAIHDLVTDALTPSSPPTEQKGAEHHE